MASIIHWNSDDSTTGEWDTVKLGGMVMPGAARVGIRFPCGIDFQKPRGKKAAKLKDVGDQPIKLRIRLQITQAADLARVPDAIALLNPRGKGSSRNPLEIVHPNANAWGVTTVVLGDIESPQPDARDGWIWEIDAYEWQPDLQAAPEQTKKPQGEGDEEAQSWAPYVDDDVAGSGTPARNGAATKNLGL